MLERINQIKNVGRFYDVLITGTADYDPSFRKFNLIYADNGTGKSMISNILKSLWKNEPERIIERKTINANGDSFISIKIDGKEYRFQNDKWNKNPRIKMEIFDEEFVSNNVFSPSGVDANTRRELFNYVVLGEENVKKISQVKEIDVYINSELKRDIEAAEIHLVEAAEAPNIRILEETVSLDEGPLAKMRQDVEEKGKLIQHSERISSENLLQKLDDFEHIDYQTSIVKDLGGLSHVAEYKAHIQKHNKWIQDGLNIMPDTETDKCPFCLQDIKDSNAITAYQEFFSKEYQDHRRDVGEKLDSAQRAYADSIINIIETHIRSNNERCNFWHKLDEEIPESIELEVEPRETIPQFKAALELILTRKQENLLEVITPSKEEAQGLAQEGAFRTAFRNYNDSIENLNHKIQKLKNANQNVPGLKATNNQNRIKVKYNDVLFHNEKTKTVYGRLKQLRREKKEREEEIRCLRQEISVSSQAILEKYQRSINKTLEKFNVEFSIEGVKNRSDRSRIESLHFNIHLRGESFDPNGSSEKPYKLTNTLSSGDKSALAFALFVAKHQTQDEDPEKQKKLEEELKNTILIFDDPITSLDFFRKDRTRIIIERFTEKARQVVVLTHSDQFAQLFSGGNEKKFIGLQKNPVHGVCVAIGNRLEDLFTVKHERDRNIIHAYLDDPSPEKIPDVAKAVRPFLETRIKQYRNDFSSKTLGQMIGKFKEESASENFIDDLEEVNSIIRSDSSHGSGEIDAHALENFTPDALTKACKIAIEIDLTSIHSQLT